MDRISPHNKVEFTILTEGYDEVILDQDPPNWDKDEKVYEVDKDSKGVLLKQNTQLEITKKGYEHLYGVRLAKGFNPESIIIKRGKDTFDKHETWRTFYKAVLDTPEAEIDIDRKVFKVPFTQGGLFDLIKANYSKQFDLVNEKDVDGNDIGSLNTILEQCNGRQIFRESIGKVEDGITIDHPVTGSDKDVARGVVLTVNPNSDRDFIKSVQVGSEPLGYFSGDYAAGQIGALLFTRSDRYRKRLLNGKIKVLLDQAKRHPGFLRLEEVFYQYNVSNSTYEYISGSRNSLAQVNTNLANQILEHDFNDHVVELEEGQGYALALYSNTDDGIGYTYQETKVTIREDATYPATVAKDLLPFEMVERFLHKITGVPNLLISNVLGRKDLGYSQDGEWSLLATTSGFWARGFDLDQTDDPKQFTISLKDVLESLNTVFPIMWTIEERFGVEYLRLEKLEYSKQSFTGIQYLKVASKPVITTLTDSLFSNVKIGYQKGGGDYEEVFGLASIHGNAEFSTSYSKKDNAYTQLSKIRADVEGHELARIKQAQFFRNEDTPYDRDIFFRHLKIVGGQYIMRTWQDDLSEAPQGEGIYSPNTMGNLLLTPFRCLLRRKRVIGTALYKDPLKSLNFISSNCFSNFSTTLVGDTELQENGSILNSELGTPYLSGDLLGFDGKIDQRMIDQIEGFTKINGEDVPNWYGIYEVNVNGSLLKGIMMKIQVNGEGKHEIALIP